MATSSSTSPLPNIGIAKFSIREKQIDAIIKMLNFNTEGHTSTSTPSWQDVWKVLIYDKYCSDVLSPLLRKGELRNQGITLHLPLQSSRQGVSDVPSLYFVTPSKDNIRKIAEDVKQSLYDAFYLNFCSPIPRPLLEELAQLTATSNSSLIHKVHDQYLNFISLEHGLFSLNTPPSSYFSFNDPTISDIQAEQNLEAVVDALFSVLVTLQVVPIIRCAKSGAAKIVAEALDQKLSQNLSSPGSNLFTSSDSGLSISSFQRPVLILLDRNVDLTVMLHHAWTYQALVHDLLGLSLNTVKVEVTEGGEGSSSTPKQVVYDLDPGNDSFWSENASLPFPGVGAAVKNAMDDYQQRMNELKLNDDVQNDDEKSQLLGGKAKDLSEIVSNIPELQEKKRLIETHTNIATAVLQHINTRQIDKFFSLEEGIITKSYIDKKEILQILQGEKGTPEDKLRFFCLYFLATKTITPQEMEQYEEALIKCGADLSPLRYLKKTKAFNESLTAPLVHSSSSQSVSKGNEKDPSSSSLGMGWMKNLVGYGGGSVESLTGLISSSFKNLLPKGKDLYVTRIVEALMDMKNTLGVEDNYLYLDPKVSHRGSSIPRRNVPFKEAIVFVVGGGNYVEYQNLIDFTKKAKESAVIGKRIIYGGTEMLNPHEFLSQLNELGRKC